MSDAKYTPHNNTSQVQSSAREQLYRLFANRPMNDPELLINFGLYARSSAMAKIFFLHEAYEKILDIPGDVYVLGTWLGQDLVTFETMRAMLEPYNASRAYVGFDTFDGYEGITAQDKPSDTIKYDGYAVPSDYKSYLAELLAYHRTENTMGHAVRHELVAGDVRETLPAYLGDHPEALVALAYFDLAVYEPTLKALQALDDRLVPGSVVVMDELNDARYPGETVAVREWLNGRNYRVTRSRFLPDRTFVQLG
ncbi:MAG: TylF/MycF/NovP-related O-methyltransferase [Paracoccaceae bacterium]